MSKANTTVVRLPDGREVCLSYGVIVAAFIPYGDMRGYVRTDKRYSVTTSRHMNAFAGHDAREIPDAELQALCNGAR